MTQTVEPAPQDFAPADMDANVPGPIFIVGCGRSGTTLLGQMLNNHPNLAIFHEADFVSLFGFYASTYDLQNDPVMQHFLDHLFTRLIHRPYTYPVYQPLDSPALREQLIASDRQPGSIFRLLMAAWAKSQGKTRWGDKDTRYPFELPAIYQAYPNARFIHIVRDPRAVVYSLQQAKGAPPSIYRQADVWVHSIYRAHQGFQQIPAAQTYELKYEDLVMQPEAQLEKICRFVGEPFDSQMFGFYEKTEEFIPMIPNNPTWATNLDKPVTTESLDKWRQHLSKEHVSIIETLAGPWMKHYQYPMTIAKVDLSFIKRLYCRAYSVSGGLRNFIRKHQWTQHMKAEVGQMQQFMNAGV